VPLSLVALNATLKLRKHFRDADHKKSRCLSFIEKTKLNKAGNKKRQ
jgi:hypothetical protein